MAKKGLGRRIDLVDMRDAQHLMGVHLKANVDTLPEYKTWEVGEPLDQGHEGSCVGHGWTHWHNAKPTGFRHPQPHGYAFDWYKRAQEIDEWPGTDYEGTSVRAGAKVALERGLITEYVWASGLDELDAWILGRGPIVIGSKWLESMDEPSADGFLEVNPYSANRGGHCYLMHGKGHDGNYKFQNSWGAEYANEGTFRLTRDGLMLLIANGGVFRSSDGANRCGMSATPLIDEYLNGHGQVIAEEAERAGLDLDLACALVQQESSGFNIFGADHREACESPETPPFCRVRVTAERVGLLLEHIDRHGFGASNGVGLTQLTYPPLIRMAEEMGGAHRPRFQCRVGFTELTNLIERYGTRTGLGIYNGGPAHPNFAYAWDVLEKRNQWKRRLKSAQ